MLRQTQSAAAETISAILYSKGVAVSTKELQVEISKSVSFVSCFKNTTTVRIGVLNQMEGDRDGIGMGMGNK